MNTTRFATLTAPVFFLAAVFLMVAGDTGAGAAFIALGAAFLAMGRTEIRRRDVRPVTE